MSDFVTRSGKGSPLSAADYDSNLALTAKKREVGRHATRTVAASDADALTKAHADYVCDGEDDQVEIQAALDTVGAFGGGVVQLSVGNFSITDTGNTSVRIDAGSHDNVWFRGVGYSTFLRLASGITEPSGVSVIYVNKGNETQIENVTISHMRISGNAAASEYDGGEWEGIDASHTKNLTIAHCTIEDCGQDGVDADDSNPGFRILHCNVLDNKEQGLHLYGIDDGLIMGNSLENNCHGWDGEGALRAALDVLRDPSQEAPAGKPRNVRIIGNVFRGNASGIRIGSALSCLVADNQIYDIDNTVESPPEFGDGILVSVAVESCQVINNHVENIKNNGIQIVGVVNVCSGNTIINTGNHGIRAANETHNPSINNNYISNTGGIGINVSNSSSSVQGNRIIEPTSNAISFQSGAANSQAINNHMSNGENHGISVSSNSSNVLIQGNFCSGFAGNNRAGINAATDDNAILNNHVTGNYWGIAIVSTSADYFVANNKVTDNTNADVIFGGSVGAGIVRGNVGYVTANRGTATISGTDTFVDITHGLDRTPSAEHIQVTPTSELVSAAKWWISDVGATTFRINVDMAPGTGESDTFSWRASVE